MAFISHCQSRRIAFGRETALVCNIFGTGGLRRRKVNRQTFAMSQGRKRCVSNASKLGLAVGIALSVSLRGATAAASTLEGVSSVSAENVLTTHSSQVAEKDPVNTALHISAGARTDRQQSTSSGDEQLKDLTEDTSPSATLLNVERASSEVLDENHQPLSQRIANKLRSRGLPDELVVFLVSALPAVELRAGVPVGFVLNVHPIKVFLLAVLGNMAPIIPLMLLLRLRIVQTLGAKILDRARRKAAAVGNANSRAAALALFVGIPLPGTGAWTGSLVAFVLGMPVGSSLAALFAGVIMAACIMTILCAMGRVGAIFAGTVLLGGGISSLLRANAAMDEKTEDERASGDANGTS